MFPLYSRGMKTYILIPLIAFVCLLSLPVQAASFLETVTEAASPPSSTAISEDNVKNLISTLESESARTELISNLQLLLSQQKKEETKNTTDMIPALTEQIGARGKISHLVKEYEKFLEKNAISSSSVHQAGGTAVVVIMTLILFFVLRKMTRKFIRVLDSLSDRAGIKLTRIALYTRAFQIVFRVLILGIATYTLAKIWDVPEISDFFESSTLRGFLTTSITVLIVAVVTTFIWETIGIYLAYVLKQADSRNQTRVKTLLPIIRNIVLSVFGVFFLMILLSEIGMNIAPLIAGAGMIGVAIGFGAQNMVKDFISGFTIILEDILRVGDVVTVAGCNGMVEKITLRKVQLRDFAGVVYTIPFSEITTIQNMTKNFSYYPIEIGIGYSHSTDHAIDVMRAVDEDLRADADFGRLILEPIEIVGVDRFADSAVIIKGRIKTRPVKQWDVGREYNRRLKIAFDANSIEMPFPQRVITIRNEAKA